MYHPAAALRSGEVLSKIEADFRRNIDLFKNPDKIGEVGELKSESEDPNQMSFF